MSWTASLPTRRLRILRRALDLFLADIPPQGMWIKDEEAAEAMLVDIDVVLRPRSGPRRRRR